MIRIYSEAMHKKDDEEYIIMYMFHYVYIINLINNICD